MEVTINRFLGNWSVFYVVSFQRYGFTFFQVTEAPAHLNLDIKTKNILAC